MDRATKDQKLKARRFVAYCRLQFATDLTADQIANRMDFGSAEALYKQLESDGSPVCGVCGLLYPEPGHREEHVGKRRKRQPGVGGGHRIRLPDASDAEGLFREALGELDRYLFFVGMEESWLEGNLEEDGFKGKHFITHSVDRDSVEVARREDYRRRDDPTEAAWKELCERHGVDPESEEIVVSVGSAAPGGVSRTPSAFLTALVADYELAALPLERLVEALHHDPDSTDWEGLYATAERLRKTAGHLAARVRGGAVEGGRGVEEVPREEHFAAWLIRYLEVEGAATDDEIHQRLQRSLPDLADRLTTKDISRIRLERLDPPE
jgi:hypothetical protein